MSSINIKAESDLLKDLQLADATLNFWLRNRDACKSEDTAAIKNCEKSIAEAHLKKSAVEKLLAGSGKLSPPLSPPNQPSLTSGVSCRQGTAALG
jgi:hypothetical protein